MAGSHEPVSGEAGDEFDGLIRSLSDKRRRFVLHRLAMAGGPVTLSDLVERLTAWEPTADVDRLRVSLLHSHLPKLADADLIEFDPASRSVSITAKGLHADEGRSAATKRYATECG